MNAKNSVPALRTEAGEILTEVGVILQYLADLKPDSSLLPREGSVARYRVMEWLSYVGSDVHKSIGPLFHPQMPAEAKEIHRQNLKRRLTYIEQRLEREAYLTGDTFTVADAYLFMMIGWEPYFKFDLTPYPNLTNYHGRIASRPSFARILHMIAPVLERIKLPGFPSAEAR